MEKPIAGSAALVWACDGMNLELFENRGEDGKQ
jgi:hypothetical protein